MHYLSADVGGTFTDLVLIDAEAGVRYLDKVPSTPGSTQAIMQGINRIVSAAGVSEDELDLFVHGLTTGTNAMLTRSGARVVLVVTEGFRDVLEIGDYLRPHLYQLAQSKPDPVVPRSRVVEVAERIDAFGRSIKTLDWEEAMRVAQDVARLKPDAVAVCLTFSHMNTKHEHMVETALGEILPDVPVYLSSRVNPQIEEFPRASTTSIAAYVGGAIDQYISLLDDALTAKGMKAPLRLMRSDGGVSTPDAARKNPANLLLSGPAGGVTAGANTARELGLANVVTFDMGGTSADFAAIVDGEPRKVNQRKVDNQPLRLPSLDMETISAGGGSIAWVDLGGALRVGPELAGADPGPACYGMGGEKATLTDAAVVLGILDPAEFLGGEKSIEPELARAAILSQIAEPLGLDLEEAALGIVRVANAGMIQAIQRLSVERGLDIRDFTLLAFGGAGPIYAPYIARELGMPEVLIPLNPGVYAAQGLLMSDVRHTAQVSFHMQVTKLEESELGKRLDLLRNELDEALEADGIALEDREFHCYGDMRCVGQYHELTLPLPLPDRAGWWDAEAVTRAFHKHHERTYGHADPQASVEVVNLRAEALGKIAKPPVPQLAMASENAPQPTTARPICLDAMSGYQDCPVYRREALLPGHEIVGPAVIAQRDSTSVILPGQRAAVTSQGFLKITVTNEKQAATSSIDPISRNVFQHQVQGIADEMSMALKRTAYSSVIWLSDDYSCGLFLPDGEMIAQADTIPAHLGIMSTALRHMFQEISREQWRPGDVVVCNDPYRGCTHTMDICLFSPVFNDGELVAITSTIAHHEDIGGRLPGSYGADNEEVFAEGIILPPLKLMEEGQPNETAFKIVAANVRLPEGNLGDLRAQIAACRTGENCVSELAARYGNTAFRNLAEACLDYAETYTRRAIAALPDGMSEAQVLVEDDVTSTDPFVLWARVTIKDDEIEIDVSASDDQRPFSLNCPEASTSAMVHYAIKCVTSPDLANNQGCVRPISVKMRRGSILAPVRPAAVGTRHHTQQAVADVVLKALAPLCPLVSAAGCQIAVTDMAMGGFDDRPEKRTGDGDQPYYVIAELTGGGMGGHPRGDGLSAVDTHGSNCAILSAEVVEERAPIRVLRTALVPGSGGPGKYRGGLAVMRDYLMLGKRGVLTVNTQQTRDDTVAWGFDGGGSGGKSAVLLHPNSNHEEGLPSKVIGRVMREGDVWRQVCAGGGGWGNPDERDPALIERDRSEGYV